MKDNKNLIIIIILGCLVLGLGGFIVYDKFISQDVVKDGVENDRVDSNADNNTNNEEDKDENNIGLTNEEIFMKELEEKLVTSDRTNGLYFDGLSVNDTNNKDFITFNIRQYMLDNDIDKTTDWGCGVEFNEKDGYVLKKDTLSKYIQEKYNVSGYYSINNGANLNYGTYEFESIDDKYVINCFARSGAGSHIVSKAIKYEETNENIYLYNKAIFCMSYEGFDCSKEPNNYYPSKSLFGCNDIVPQTNAVCEKISSLDGEAQYNYLLNKFYDELNTYKHTFKKSGNEYYWVKTEIVK